MIWFVSCFIVSFLAMKCTILFLHKVKKKYQTCNCKMFRFFFCSFFCNLPSNQLFKATGKCVGKSFICSSARCEFSMLSWGCTELATVLTWQMQIKQRRKVILFTIPAQSSYFMVNLSVMIFNNTSVQIKHRVVQCDMVTGKT